MLAKSMFGGGNVPPAASYTDKGGWRYGNANVRPEFVSSVVDRLRGGMAPQHTIFQQQQNASVLRPQGSPTMDNMRSQQRNADYIQAMRMNKYAADNSLQNPGFEVQPMGRQRQAGKPAFPKTQTAPAPVLRG